MSKKEEPQIPEYIAKHQRLYKHASKLLDTTSHVHSMAYSKAVDEHLMDKSGTVVDFEKLDDHKVQQMFVKTMSDMYVKAATDHFKVKGDLGDLEKDMLMQTYTGFTRDQLKDIVHTYGKRLTHSTFEGLKQNFQRNIEQRLYTAAGSHLEESQIETILKHAGVANKVDSSKVTLEEARRLLEIYHEEGSITDPKLREVVRAFKFKKKEEKKAA